MSRVGLCWVLAVALRGEESGRAPKPWDTCWIVDGKGYEACGKGDRARPFREFLAYGPWATEPDDRFSGELHYDGTRGEFKAAWRELGRFGASRAREIRYLIGDSPAGMLLVVERAPGVFAPVFKWAGGHRGLPRGEVWRNGAVLATEFDYRGSFREVRTWAWVWGARGPVVLDLDAATGEAVSRVAPGYGCYRDRMDWPTLHLQTYAWQGEWPGKIGVHTSVDAWFRLQGAKLVLVRASFRDFETEVERRWP